MASEPELIRTRRYLRLLLILLVSAAFFEGYDGSILALLLPNIQSTFHVSEAVLGLTRIPIELGLFVAFFVARLSDRLGPAAAAAVVGRRLHGLHRADGVSAGTSGRSPFFQFATRIFLGAEYAVGVTMIVEEYPADRRGRALGTLLTFNALGTIAVGLLLGAGLQDGPLEWRAFYLVGLVPLLVLAFFRRRLKETRRFIEEKQRREHGEITEKVPFLEPWKPQYRRNLVLVGHACTCCGRSRCSGRRRGGRSTPSASAGFTAHRRCRSTSSSAYGLGCVGYYVCGRAMERFGRRPDGDASTSLGGIVFAVILFQVSDKTVSVLRPDVRGVLRPRHRAR